MELLPLVAVNEAEVAVVTAATFAVKVAEEAVAGTVTELGTVTDPLLLASAMLTPPDGAEPDSVMLHESARVPVTEVLLHVSPLTVGVAVDPVPLKLTAALVALLDTASCPVTEPPASGLNCTDKTSACPGFSVIGKLPPETEKPVPEIESALMDTGAVPFEVKVTDFVTAVPTATFPKEREDELRLREGVPTLDPDPLRLIDVVFEVDPWVAVRVTVWDALTAATVAVKDALLAPEGTVNEAGTVTAALLLARLTANPVLGADALNVTVQVSVPAPTIEELAQVRPEREGVPEPDPFP